MKKRIASVFLTLVLALTLLPVQVLAEDTAYTVGEDTGVSARTLAGTGGSYLSPAGTEWKADNIDAYLANGLGDGVYTLAEDVTISGVLTVTGDATVDLNGHVLRFDQSAQPDSIFRVTSGSTLTLDDSDPAASHSDASLPAGGLITGGKGFKYDNGAGQSYTYYGGGVYVETDASFVLAGGTIYACGVQSGAQSAYGGGIYAEGGSVTIKGGAIRNCAVSADYGTSGGAICARAGSVTMSGGVISGCSAMSGGGILAVGCTVRITGGRIENCKASKRGGGLNIRDHADQISVLDAAISGCEAENGGGVALMGFAELELGENARITGCTATNGAAVYVDLGSTFTVNHPGCFLYANGGRVEGTVYVGTNKFGTKNNYVDSVKATNAIDHTDGKPTTVFTGDVSCEGDIRGGIFHGSVTVTDSNGNMGTAWEKFCGNLSGGTFYGPVTTECHVSGGTFYRGLTMNKNAKLSGQPIDTGDVINDTTNTPEPNVTPATVTYRDGGTEYAKQLVRKGTKVTAPDDPQKDGWAFVAWLNAAGAVYKFNSSIYGDVTFTAKWRKALTGAGTEQDPYRIATAEELGLFRDTVNGDGGRGQNTACAVLTADIDLQNQLWTPIGNGQYPYGGIFDGGGHTIKNLNVNSTANHAGLFGDAHNAVFKDLTVAGSVTITSGYAGGLLGSGTGAITITNCINTAAVASGESAGGLVGVFGDADSDLTITGCANLGTVTAELMSAGIISQASGNGLISDCYNAGEVKILRSKGFTFLGGIAGWITVRGDDAAKTLTLRNCYSVGALTAPDAEDIGGIVGFITAGGGKGKERYRLENCYYLNTTAERAASSGNEDKYTAVGEVAARHGVRFGDGTVLSALIAGRAGSAHPWNSRCQYLAAAKRTIPVFANQSGDEHTHQVSTRWEGDATGHWRACACGWPEDEALHHIMDDGDCTTPETCTDCGYTVAANPAHTWGSTAFDNGDGTHARRCTVCIMGRMVEPCTDTDKDHRCDVCDAVLSQCADANKDHKCDYCGKTISNHADANKDHICDYCDKIISNHADANKDHICDICDKAISNHADANKDHKCDTCGKTISNHADANKDHICDTCDKIISNHADANKDHICDICNKTISNHADANKDHKCDYCDKTISNHADANKDHICDICNKTISNHADANKDHKCDYCDKTISNHADANKDHICDTCDKTISNHADANKDHKCDTCGKIISNHADVDKDHKCDYCDKTISNHAGGTATCTAQAVCTYCGRSYGALDPDHHSALRHVTGRAATRDRDGRIEHWRCSGCDRYFGDAAATLPITRGETVLPRLGSAASAAPAASAATGDSGVALWLVLLTGSAAATVAVCCGRKRRGVR